MKKLIFKLCWTNQFCIMPPFHIGVNMFLELLQRSSLVSDHIFPSLRLDCCCGHIKQHVNCKEWNKISLDRAFDLIQQAKIYNLVQGETIVDENASRTRNFWSRSLRADPEGIRGAWEDHSCSLTPRCGQDGKRLARGAAMLPSHSGQRCLKWYLNQCIERKQCRLQLLQFINVSNWVKSSQVTTFLSVSLLLHWFDIRAWVHVKIRIR